MKILKLLLAVCLVLVMLPLFLLTASPPFTERRRREKH